MGLQVQSDPDWKEITLADGSKLKTEGQAQFTLQCGGYKGKILARVFPNLHKEIILGIPWLRQVNPVIDWAERCVKVYYRGGDIILPLTQKCDQGAETTEINLCTAKQMAKQAKRGHILFLAIVRSVAEEPKEENTEDTDE